MCVPCFVITPLCGLSAQAGGCNMMSFSDDRQVLVLLLHTPFLPMTFLAVVSVVYRKSTAQKTSFGTIKYKGICQKVLLGFFFSLYIFSMFSQELISLHKDSKAFFHTENFDGEYYTGQQNWHDCLVYNQVAAGKAHLYAKNSQYHKVVLGFQNQEAEGVCAASSD